MKKAKLNVKGFVIFSLFPLVFLIISVLGFVSIPTKVDYDENELIYVEFKYYTHFTYSKSIVVRIISEDGRNFRMTSASFPGLGKLSEGDVIQISADYYDVKYKEKYNEIYVHPIEIVVNGEMIRSIDDCIYDIKEGDKAVCISSTVFLVLSIVLFAIEAFVFLISYETYKDKKRRIENRLRKREERLQKKKESEMKNK